MKYVQIRPVLTVQRLGDFEGGELLVDWVKVYQNVNYLDHIKSPEDFVK